MSGASSTLSLTTFMRPELASARRASAGETIRQGPHHGAQKSTTTGTDAVISSANESRSASTSHGSFVPHTAHCGTPSGLAGTLLGLPQLGQVTIAPAMGATSSWPRLVADGCAPSWERGW